MRIFCILSAFILLSACAGAPEKVTFEIIATANESKKATYERITPSFDADCAEGMCEVSEDTLNRLVAIITGLNDEMQLRVNSYNLSIDSITHCEYSNTKYRESLGLMESASMRQSITSTVKEVALGLTCAGLLWAK